MLAEAADTVPVPEAVSVLENVLLPEKVCVPVRIANSLEVLGCVKVRVVPVVIPDSENSAFFGECLNLCVSDRAHAVFRYGQASKRPANIMAS
ncbi:hypothetical protein EV658_1024 [Phaeovulum veldkampii DSM 11550]|nr:hypothetical protein EV658_1024 [Phaeovulum veldkampii DSM 11550]